MVTFRPVLTAVARFSAGPTSTWLAGGRHRCNGCAPVLSARRGRLLSGGPRDPSSDGSGSELPSAPLDDADAALRQSLLTRATLRESVSGQRGLLDETKKTLERSTAAEQGLSGHTSADLGQRADVAAIEKSEPETPLIKLLKERMRLGPVPVSEYMQLAMSHPEHGYYMSKGFTGIFGQRGDFTTAPEISQMFGEIIAVWVVWIWQTLGCPKKVQLIELGPGRGTMMSDMLRCGPSPSIFPSLSHSSIHVPTCTSPFFQPGTKIFSDRMRRTFPELQHASGHF